MASQEEDAVSGKKEAAQRWSFGIGRGIKEFKKKKARRLRRRPRWTRFRVVVRVGGGNVGSRQDSHAQGDVTALNWALQNT